MFKKLLITLFLFTTFFVGNSFAKAGWPHKYDNHVITKDAPSDIKAYQQNLKNLSPAAITRISNHFLEPNKATWKLEPMKIERVKALLSDGQFWEVTKFAQEISSWKTNKEADATTQAAGKGTKKIWDKSWKKQLEATCKYDPDKDEDIRDSLEKCVWSSALVQVKDAYVTGWLKDVLNGWIQKIAGFLALGAIFAIAFGSLKMTLSMWEDEKIKKAKDIIKWGIIGFIAVISAGFLIATLVNLIYSLAG